MKKFLTLMLMTVSMMSVAEAQYEAYINESENGIYIFDNISGGVQYCTTVDIKNTKKDIGNNVIMACTEWSYVSNYPLETGEYNRWNTANN
jgi:hypothetical protein